MCWKKWVNFFNLHSFNSFFTESVPNDSNINECSEACKLNESLWTESDGECNQCSGGEESGGKSIFTFKGLAELLWQVS